VSVLGALKRRSVETLVFVAVFVVVFVVGWPAASGVLAGVLDAVGVVVPSSVWLSRDVTVIVSILAGGAAAGGVYS